MRTAHRPAERCSVTSPRHPPVAGFTLVEVMAAVAILALAIATSVTALQRAFLNLDSARNIATAGRIMQCELEKERLMTWTAVSANTYLPAVDSSLLAIPAIAGRFTLTRATSLIANRSGNMLKITVTVTWRNYDGRTQTRSESTYYGNGGLFTFFTTQS